MSSALLPPPRLEDVLQWVGVLLRRDACAGKDRRGKLLHARNPGSFWLRLLEGVQEGLVGHLSIFIWRWDR